MFERYTPAARRSVVLAQEETRARAAPRIGVEHLLLGILQAQDAPVVSTTLAELTVSVPELYRAVDVQLPVGPAKPEGHIPFGEDTKAVMVRAMREAKARSDRHIGNEHLLLAVVAEGGSTASRVLEEHGATYESMVAGLEAAPSPGFRVRTTKGSGRFRRGGKG